MAGPYTRIDHDAKGNDGSSTDAVTIVTAIQEGLEAVEAKARSGQEVFSYPGQLPVVGAPIAIGLPVYNDSQFSWTIKSVRATLGTGPVTTGVVVDIRYHATVPASATTIFNTKPTLTVGGAVTNKVTSLLHSTIVSGGVLFLDLFGVDSGGGARDLVVQIDYEY